MKKRYFFIAVSMATILMGGGGALHAAQDGQKSISIFPVDEGAKDPEFFAFRRNLIHALIAQDEAYLKSAVAPDIKWSFGGGDGAEGFYSGWNDGAGDGQLYNTLLGLLLNGGTFISEGTFCAPYTYKTEAVEDPFSVVIAVDRDVPVFDKPSQGAKVIGRVSFQTLRRNEYDGNGTGYYSVYTPAGKAGFVREADAFSPVGYRACFSKTDGKYKMNLMVAGD